MRCSSYLLCLWPTSFLILYAFSLFVFKDNLTCVHIFQLPSICCWLPSLYIQYIVLFRVSNLYSQLPTKIVCPKGKANSTCPKMNLSSFLSICILSVSFHYLCSNPIRTLMFQKIILFTWWLASKRQEAETARSVKDYVCNWCIITSDKFCCSNQSQSLPRFNAVEKLTPLWWGSGKFISQKSVWNEHYHCDCLWKMQSPQWQD